MIQLGNLLLSCMIQLLMMNQLLKLLMVTNTPLLCYHLLGFLLFGYMADGGLVTCLPVEEEKKEKTIHKSLAEILGIKKRGEPVEQAKVAVVIDPKIAKVLRPHQIEGVKVHHPLSIFLRVQVSLS